MIEFQGNEFPTIGVEEEFHLIDPETADLKPCITEIMPDLDEEMRHRVCYELFNSVIESRSRVHSHPDDLLADIKDARRRIARVAKAHNALIVSSASHPFGRWQDRQIVENQHYQWIRENFGYVAYRMLSFGLHVHVGVQSAQVAIYVMNQMRKWLYPLLALSANSPIYDGIATRMASTRAVLFNAMPRTLFPPEFQSFDELEDFYNKLLETGDATRPGDLWWNIRPQPPLGTVEIRVLDLPTDPARLTAITALCQAAIATYQEDCLAGIPQTPLRLEYLMQNRWRAIRDGLEAVVIEPETGRVCPITDMLAQLLDKVSPMVDRLQTHAHIDVIRKIIREGNEAQWQLQRWEELNHDPVALELEIAQRTMADTL